MRQILATAFRWTIQHFVWFVVIVATLVAVNFFRTELREFRSHLNDLDILKDSKRNFGEHIRSIEIETTQRTAALQKASLDTLDFRIGQIRNDIKTKSAALMNLDVVSILSGAPLDTAITEHLKKKAEVIVLNQELAYLLNLRSIATMQIERKKGLAELERRRRIHVAAYSELKKNESASDTVKAAHPIASKIPGTQPYSDLKALAAMHNPLADANQRAFKEYEDQRIFLSRLKFPTSPLPFKLDQKEFTDNIKVLDKAMADRSERLRRNWVSWASGPIVDVLPTATTILIGVVLTPIAIKAAFFFILAPLASRLPPICLLPNCNGTILGVADEAENKSGYTSVSSVSVQLTVHENQELLVHPEYIQSSTNRGTKSTKWLLDWSYPLTSIASGMYGLTRVRADSPESVVVSDTKDPLSEIGLIDLPEGSAVVLQPRSLVGVVFQSGAPIKISRHWRLRSLHAWLTLQLRYLVFHGPGTLIVKGCRGIKIEKAGSGRRISQAATLGFSANLGYSTMRCETFAAYFFGKQPLLSDSFSGNAGYFIYEEMPDFGRNAGIAGRWFEGFTDTVLKAFGV